MRYSLFIYCSALALSACTQPAVVVDMRGHEDFSRGGGRSVAYNVAAPVAPVTTGLTIGNHAPSAAQTTETVAPLSSSIAISDLQPAAGKAQAMKTEPAQTAPAKAEAVTLNAWTGKARDAGSFGSTSAPAAKGAAFIWPVASREVKKATDGISIAAANGEPVWASADGEVVYADSKMAGYGKMVIVKHAAGKTTTYAHLARYAVEKYDRVKQGDIIGYVGTTGNAKSPQLYFSMRDGTKAVDPQEYLDRKMAGL